MKSQRRLKDRLLVVLSIFRNKVISQLCSFYWDTLYQYHPVLENCIKFPLPLYNYQMKNEESCQIIKWIFEKSKS